MAVSKRVRYEVLRRDNHACRYCGGVAPDVVLTIDHVHPVALGGGDGPENLVAACRDCNAGKTSTTPDGPLVADVAQDALRWSKAMEAVVEIRRHRQWEIDVSVARFVELWNDWKYPDGTTTELPGDWESSVRRFLIAGLDADRDMKEFIRQTMGFTNARDPFAMFCKKCWDEINDRQRETQAALAALPTDDDDEDEGVRFVTLPEVAGRIIACLPDWDIEDLDRWYAMSIDDPSGYFHSGMRYGFDFIPEAVMARSYAPLYTSIWLDDDFKALTSEAQRLYMVAFSQPHMNYCGVVSFTERRWAGYAADTTPEGVARAVKELQEARMVVLDEDTEELWVRSFIRHNKVLEQPKVLRLAEREFKTLLSPAIKKALQTEHPDVFGTPSDTPPHTPADGYDEGYQEGYDASSHGCVGEGSRFSVQGSSLAAPEKLSLTLVEVDQDDGPDFEKDFWRRYPKRNNNRVGKPATRALWDKLPLQDQIAACGALANYTASGTYPKDPERYLKHRVWVDWLEWVPPVAEAPAGRSGNRDRLAAMRSDALGELG